MVWGIVGCTGNVEIVGLPSCGDGEVDASEACDDGNAWGGDGCTADCVVETEPLEAEPNDEAASAQAVETPAMLLGHLVPGDVDCFSLAVPEAGAVRATLTEPGAETCSFDAVLQLFDEADALVATGLPSVADGCSAIDPDVDTFARYLPAGTYTVCASPAFDGSVPAYALELDVFDSCTELDPLAPDPSQDLEADGLADVCDDDDDDDGVFDDVDNCPEVPNGPATTGWNTSDEGRIRQWMVLGPFSDGASPKGCEPTAANGAGETDATSAPQLGDVGAVGSWFAEWQWRHDSSVMRFTDWFSNTPAPREAYAAVWLFSEAERDVELALGADDGFRVWVGDVEVGVHRGCQGVYPDAYRYPATLLAGWNRLLVKVYDGGGGWGVVARVFEPDGTTPVVDLDTSLAPAPWADDQSDTDGDGLGDICDPTP